MGTSRTRGFTLVELLIVVVIIAILATIALPRIQNAAERAKESAARDQLYILRNAVSLFHQDTDRYPLALTDLAAETAPTQAYNGGGIITTLKASKYKGPYIQGQALPVGISRYISYNGSQKGRVWCPLPGKDLRGIPFSTW